jgi:hypothetical protein
MRTKADIGLTYAFSGFARQAGQQVDVPHCLDSLFCARAVPVISILPTGRRTATGSMHPADTTAANRRRTTKFPCFDWLCTEARRGRFAWG